MATPAPPPVVATPTLAQIASLVHHAAGDEPMARFVHVQLDPQDQALDLGLWDIPPVTGHPIDPLVGYLAPAAWCAVGLTSSGRIRLLDRPSSAPRPTVSTVLLHRDGTASSILGAPGEPERVIDEPPEGLVADVLRRVLGQPTPPPDASTATVVELTWLDRIAAGLLHGRPRGRSWRWLADRHPLRGGGPVPSPEELAARTVAYADERTWAGLRLLAVTQDLPAARYGPPGGTTAPACSWFDDGSFSRWLLSSLPPSEALVGDLLSVLPDHVGADLLTALGEVDETWPAAPTS